MATLYVTEPGAQVHKADERLVVMCGQEMIDDIPMIKVDRVVLMGRGVGVTTPAMFALTRRGVDIVYLTGRGRYVSRVVGQEHKHVKLRHTQALAVSDAQRAQAMAQAIVRGKVHNQRVLVQRHAEGAAWGREALATMDRMKKQVEAAGNLDELRGCEGLAAKEYFGLLRRLLRPPADGQAWGFERREYYPPPDPINALLSFGYTLLLNDLIAACQLAGLDPYLGFFHAIDFGRPSMALDLEEEFRPIVVDSIVLTAVNRLAFGLKDFEAARPQSKEAAEQAAPGDKTRAVYLKEKARNRFVELYELRVNEQILYPALNERTTYRRIFELQAYHMAAVILGEAAEYTPLIVR